MKLEKGVPEIAGRLDRRVVTDPFSDAVPTP